MSKQLKGPQIVRAMVAANSAIAADQHDSVEQHLERAHNLILEGPLPMALHGNLIAEWGRTGLNLRQRGRADLANRCTEMASLLQARLDAGDYTREIF